MSQTSIAQLLDDICGLRDTIAYCENRILRKELAIAELMHSNDVKEDTKLEAPQRTGQSVRGWICDVWPTLDEPVTTGQVQAAVIQEHPESHAKICAGIHAALKSLVNSGKLKRDGGYYRKP